MSEQGLSFDEFQALEQKVLRAVEVVKRERAARAQAEAEVASLRTQLEAQTALIEEQMSAANKERETVRQRVEGMLRQMDDLI
jgi:chromosome segregation ATPase